MTLPAPLTRTPLFPQMRLAQVDVIDRAARALAAQVDDLDDAGLMADAATLRVVVDGLYRTRAQLGDLLARDGIPVPPVPNNIVLAADALADRCVGCGRAVGHDHLGSCSL